MDAWKEIGSLVQLRTFTYLDVLQPQLTGFFQTVAAGVQHLCTALWRRHLGRAHIPNKSLPRVNPESKCDRILGSLVITSQA